MLRNTKVSLSWGSSPDSYLLPLSDSYGSSQDPELALQPSGNPVPTCVWILPAVPFWLLTVSPLTPYATGSESLALLSLIQPFFVLSHVRVFTIEDLIRCRYLVFLGSSSAGEKLGQLLCSQGPKLRLGTIPGHLMTGVWYLVHQEISFCGFCVRIVPTKL